MLKQIFQNVLFLTNFTFEQFLILTDLLSNKCLELSLNFV